MKVAIIGTVGIPARYGGFETLAEQLAKRLSGSCDMVVFCSTRCYSEPVDSFLGARLEYVNLHPNGLSSIVYDIVSLARAAAFSDTILVLGVSGCMALPLVKLLYPKVRFIVNIDGLEWRRPKWSLAGSLFLAWSERMAVRHAHSVVTDSAVITEYVRERYGRKSVHIAYGGDHAVEGVVGSRQGGIDAYAPPGSRAAGRSHPDAPVLSSAGKLLDPSRPFFLTVCRIEPENNVHVILEAWSELDSTLVVVGNWSRRGYASELYLRYASRPNIHLFEAIYEPERLNRLRSKCVAYVHGHSAGGTNPSLVEAMWHGLPVIAYDVSYNRETTGNGAWYFRDAEDIVRIVEGFDEAESRRIGETLRAIAEVRYRWDMVAAEYSRLFSGDGDTGPGSCCDKTESKHG